MRELIRRHGPCRLRPHRGYYEILVRSIISQQLSSKAAATIINRFVDACAANNGFPTPRQILDTPDTVLRAAGLSGAKASFIKDLAAHLDDGRLNLKGLSRKTDDRIIAMLTPVKGIGVWTAQMFLIFSLGRLDVLPVADLGVRNAVKRYYGVSRPPTPADIEAVAAKHGWRPYCSVASWYLWRAVEDKAADCR